MTEIIHMRQRRRRAAERGASQRTGRWGLGGILLVSVSLVLSVTVMALWYENLTLALPSLETFPLLLDPPHGQLLTPTQFYDRMGEHLMQTLENPATGQRLYLRLNPAFPDHFPEVLAQATVAAEDPSFWTNPGYSFSGFTDPQPVTLAQKLVSSLLFWNEPEGTRRVLRERLLAGQSIHRFGREQVLEWYLNYAYYGHQAYGAEAAARVYLGKSATDLNLAEAALLAAVAEAPDLNPIDTPDIAISRQRQVLDQMVDQHLISKGVAIQAKNEELSLAPEPPVVVSEYATFIDLVIRELAPAIPRIRLERGGLKVITTLDYDLQFQATCALKTQLSRLAGLGSSAASISTGQSADFGEDTCQSARLLSTLPPGESTLPSELEGNVVILAPRSGEILVATGGNESGEALPSLGAHEPGTLLSPFIYLDAFTRGLGPASLVWDIPTNLPPGVSQEDVPEVKFHGPMRMRTALANDYLAPALQTLTQLGPINVWNTARQVGLSSLNPTTVAAAQRLLLEGGDLSLVEIVQAYGVLSTQGVLIGFPQVESETTSGALPLFPTTVRQVEDRTGKQFLTTPPPVARPVISAQLAYLITHILSDEAARWPSLGHPNPLEVGRPVAVKTGATADGLDAWTVGATPGLVVGVWIGSESQTTEGTISPMIAGGLWNAILKTATRNTPPEGWPTPPGISTLEVCDPSGMLPTPECPIVVQEVFAPGTEPTHPDTLYRKLQINRETGKLATVFTPPEMIDERVYLVPPPEASEWAQQAGLPIPPESYDIVSQPATGNDQVKLISPAMFANIHGPVRIMGTAAGEGLKSFQVQVGQGLNPQQWLLVGEGSDQPVNQSLLATWDTMNLNGLYAIRLLVVREGQRVDSTVVQVTVDNTPPQVTIDYPDEDQQFAYPEDRTITIQLTGNDNLGLDRLELFVDDRLVTTFSQPPFAFPWETTPGEHVLRAKAYDLAGNSTETQVLFSVLR